MTLTLIKAYLFSRDPEKRALFLDLFRLCRGGKVSIFQVVFALVSLEGILRLQAENATMVEEWKARIRQYDRGPWEAQSAAQALAGSVPRTD